MNMRMIAKLAPLAAMGLLAAACSNNDAYHGLSASDAAKLQAEHNGDQPALASTPNAETWFAAGQLAEAEGNPDLALDDYQQALKLKPNQLGALYREGVLYAQARKYPQAIDAWTKYIAATDDSALGYNNLAFCYELQGDSVKAEQAYREGIARDPKNVACRTDYGLMLARHQRVNEAIVQWQVVLKPAEIHYNLGSVYEMQGRKVEAKKEYAMALALDPEFRDAQQRVAALDQD